MQTSFATEFSMQRPVSFFFLPLQQTDLIFSVTHGKTLREENALNQLQPVFFPQLYKA